MEQLFFLVDFLFAKNGNKTFVAVNKKSCISDKFYGSKICHYANIESDQNKYSYLNKEDVKFLIKVNLKETFIRFGEYIFKQEYGISQGGNASPLTCDLTLSVIEYRFMTNKANSNKICHLSNVYRYIDDLLCTSTDGDTFLNLANEIYPSSLPLNHASGNEFGCDFLDLRIQLKPDFRIKV